MDESERPLSFIPEKHDSLRRVPLYQNGILERCSAGLRWRLCCVGADVESESRFIRI